MATEKKLYRSRDSLLGGVCSGIAAYTNIDPIIVQIITVILTLATGGLLIIPYVALWIILPKAPDPMTPVEVQPQEVRSDTYGQVSYVAKQQDSAGSVGGFSSTSPSYGPYTGNAHVPPVPPFASSQTQAQVSSPPFTSSPPTPQQPYTTTPPAPQTQAVQPPPKNEGSSGSAGAALWFGFVLLFIGISALLGAFVTGVEWWQFWPLLFVIGGIGEMVVPGKKGHRMSHFINGLMQFAFGVSALPFSLGIISLASIEPILTNLWPILLIMAGLFVLGGAMNAPLITFIAGLCFIAFCVVGIGWFSIPGPTDMITLTLPTGQVFTYAINPWI